MRFVGNIVAWIAASIVAYILASVASQNIVLNGIAALGPEAAAQVTPMVRLESSLDAVLNTLAYFGVIAIGFLVAFYIADLVKALIPQLSLIAYPVAGGTAIVTALSLMKWRYDVYPITGAEDPLGFWLQIGAGVIGGVVFEIFRPK